MRTFTIFTKHWIQYHILVSVLLISFSSGASPAEDMNLFRYSAKRLSNKVSPSVKAVLMECPKASMTPSCQRKIMVNVHVSPEEPTSNRQRYLLLDEVYDKQKQTRAKLMSPYLIELTQGEPVLMYPLELMKDFECKSCNGKSQPPSENRAKCNSLKSNTKIYKESRHNDGLNSANQDMMKNLQSLSRNNLKSNYKAHGSTLRNSITDEKDMTLDLDSALDDEKGNFGGYRNKDQPQTFDYRTNHDSVKRNPKNIEKLLMGESEYDDSNRNYDAMFDDLERKNEEIKKDILEILRPALQITDADLKNAGAVNSNPVSNVTESPSQLPLPYNQQPASSGNAPCLQCPPCPTCPPAAPSAPSAQKPKYEGTDVTMNRPEIPQSVPTQRFLPGVYGGKRGHRRGYVVRSNSLAPLRRDDLPIQEFSEDSSNSDDVDVPGSDEVPGDGSLVDEEAEDIFSSIDVANQDPLVQNNKIASSKSGLKSPNQATSAKFRPAWDNAMADPLQISTFNKYDLDPIRYDGPGANKVDRYQSLLGNSKSDRFFSSPFKKQPHKKDAKFVSFSNGYGLNVDSTDLLNNSYLMYKGNKEHEPPMPQLHHYYLHDEPSLCPHCGLDHSLSSPIVGVQRNNQYFNKNIKKSIPEVCPYGKLFGFTRKISTSKINPFQKLALNPGATRIAYHDRPQSNAEMVGFQDQRDSKLQEDAGRKGCGSSCSGNCNQPKCNSGARENQELQQSPRLLAQQRSQSRGGSLQGSRMEDEEGSSTNLDNDNLQYGSNQEMNILPVNVDSDSKPLSYNWELQSPDLTAEKLSGKSAAMQENNQHQLDVDGDDYDYYEEEVDSVSGYPNVVASKPKIRYPGVYQRPVYVPEVPLNSEDEPLAYIDGSPKDAREAPNSRARFKGGETNDHRQINDYSRDSLNMLSPAEVLLSQVDQNMLPDKVPYQSIMGDPNLNVGDKMHLMEVIDPYNSHLEHLLKYLEADVQNSHIPYFITKPEMGDGLSQDLDDVEDVQRKDQHENSIQKRSFLVYDDLEMRDADLDYEGLTAARHVPAFDGSRLSREPYNNARLSYDSMKKAKKSIRSVGDIWYSVFNMSAPLQFLTTRVRIFRKKANSWWKIVPSITLTSLSGIYANANLSILFSSHVEIYNLEKPLALKNYRLFIPKNQTNLKSSDILAIDKSKLRLDQIESDESIRDSVCAAAINKFNTNPDGTTNLRKRNDDNEPVHSLQDLGYFPSTMNILEQCKNDPDHLCLNMLDKETPGYRIKVQIPFRDNSLVYRDYFKVRISSVTVDGTINGAVQIIVGLINEALLPQGFDVVIANCPVTCGEKNVVHKLVPPHRGVTVAFLLPLEDNDTTAKHHCEVQVKTSSNNIISRRTMIVQPSARCLCIWQCSCHCVKEIVGTSVSDMCRPLKYSEENDAGFDDADQTSLTWTRFTFWIAIFLLLLVLFGCVKACLGCCLAVVGSWKYNYLQPMKKYEEASRSRRFFINSLFFLCFPFICLCRCFNPTEEDMLKSSANWECSVKQRRLDSSDYETSETDEEFRKDKLAHEQKKSRSRAGAESGYTEAYAASAQEYLFETYHDEEEVMDNNYVLSALNESRESIQKMDAHYSEQLPVDNEENVKAVEHVGTLLAAKIVYRTFKLPVGNADLPPDQAFSIRGYFIPAVGPGYQFITHTPLRQHWRVCPDIHSLRPIIPPTMLLSKDFTRSYANKKEVLLAGDLSICPYITAPCINVLVQDISMYMRADEDDDDDDDDGDDVQNHEDLEEFNS